MPTTTTVANINPDIAKERKAATFDVEEFAIWWHGGADKLKEKRDIINELAKDPELKDEIPFDYLSYQDQYNSSVKRGTMLAKKLKKLQEMRNPGGKEIYPFVLIGAQGAGFAPCGTPLTVHCSMFVPTIEMQANSEQLAKWLPLATAGKIIGTYAQTELGHGTFVRGIETRADYDPKTEEFVLNSTSITAYKWWPGGLGNTANHAVVLAQLYINDKSKGVQFFMVQLRDEETHMPLAGVHIGDVGNKLAYKGVNNGFVGFKNVRIPRMNMLMKNAQVHADGTFVSSPASVLAYWTMVYVRTMIVIDSTLLLSQAATIVTRYSAVRRQSVINRKYPEHQIIDHVTQQLKVFPEIAKIISLKVAAEYIYDMYSEVTTEIEGGKFDRLGEIHALSCCLKSIVSTDAANGVEILRLACGGHGYMLASNLPGIYGFAVSAVTYEGENTVMLLQTARFLMKAWASALKGEKLVPTVAYLADAVKTVGFPMWDVSLDCMVKTLQFTAANKIRVAFNHLSERRKQGMISEEASNATSIELAQAADLHGRAFIAATAWQKLAVEPNNRSTKLNAVLLDLLELYLANACLRHMSDILRFINITEEGLCGLQNILEQALTHLRPNAVAIVDGFDFHDRQLNSVLGSYDGNAYKRIFEAAVNSPMNQIPVQKSFHDYLKPFMKSNI